MEASAIPANVGLARTRLAIGAPLLRIRSDEQLVSLFRSGSEDAFRAIHDRYRARLYAYTRQMLAGSGADAEDAVQDIFVRAYGGLRANRRELALRAWLYRIAHNRCIDELRRPQPIGGDMALESAPATGSDPVIRLEQRDALARLIADVQRLPEQQRSALLMRELGGMPYADVSGALGVSVPAVKSLLVRARVGLAQANEARDTACARIREDLIFAHDRGVRASGLARRHMRDCPGCRMFRTEVRGVSRQLSGIVPALGPLGLLGNLLGIGGAGGGGAAAGSSAMAGGTASLAGGLAGTGATAAGGLAAGTGAVVGAGHVVTLIAAAVVTAGGAIELQHIAPPAMAPAHHHHVVARPAPAPAPASPAAAGPGAVLQLTSAPVQPASVTAGDAAASPARGAAPPSGGPATPALRAVRGARRPGPALSLPEIVDPDTLPYASALAASSTATPGATDGAPATGTATPGTGTTVPDSSTSTAVSTTPGTSSPTVTGTPAGSAGSESSTAPGTSGSATAGSTTAGTSSTAPAGSAGTSAGTAAGAPTTATPTGTPAVSSPSAATGTGSSTGASTMAGVPVTSQPATPVRASGPATRTRSSGRHRASHRVGAVAVFTMTGN